MRIGPAPLFALILGLCQMTIAAETDPPMVFVSSFKAGEEGAIHALRLDGDSGKLEPVLRNTDPENPYFLALSPGGKFLYSIHTEKFGGEDDEEVAAYQVEGRTGKLTLLNRQSARGSASCFLEVDATGKTIVVANYSSGSVASLPIREDGSLGEAASFVQHEGGSGVDAKRQKGPYAHCIVISPNNRHVFAADLGLDQVLCYRLDAAGAKLEPNSSQPFAVVPPGSGPRHLTFDPSGKRLYCINELISSVSAFDYDEEKGTLTHLQTSSTLPEEFEGKSYCADLEITPDGRFLYGTNRGHDSIAAFRLLENGSLKRIEIRPSLGKGPQNLAITPDGKWLLCANMPGNNVAVFRIDPEKGTLAPAGDPVEIPMPSCIQLLP